MSWNERKDANREQRVKLVCGWNQSGWNKHLEKVPDHLFRKTTHISEKKMILWKEWIELNQDRTGFSGGLSNKRKQFMKPTMLVVIQKHNWTQELSIYLYLEPFYKGDKQVQKRYRRKALKKYKMLLPPVGQWSFGPWLDGSIQWPLTLSFLVFESERKFSSTFILAQELLADVWIVGVVGWFSF